MSEGQNWQHPHLAIARARRSLQRSLSRTLPPPRARPTDRNAELQAVLQEQRAILQANLDKLDRPLLRVAAFGAVSRGKSAVLNALLGQNLFPTGPLNGVTQWTRSALWQEANLPIPVELIDTPGIDEVDGGDRAAMAAAVAAQADVILFVVAGDVTRSEYVALRRLWDTHKPLLLVFNKTDLYPERDRRAILHQLQTLARYRQPDDSHDFGNDWELPLSEREIACVAADPLPRRVRETRPDGTHGERLETPPPDVSQLRDRLRSLLSQGSETLLALNALVQGRDADRKLTQALVELRDRDADELIWKFARYKAAAVAVNPVFFLDVLGGTVADLVLVRSLARLYDLPMTGHDAGKLLRTILVSSGGFLLSETLSNALFGIGKTAAFPGYLGAAIAQASVSGYGTYAVGQAAKLYLEQGCTWGTAGADTAIRELLSRVDRHSVFARLQRDLTGGGERSPSS